MASTSILIISPYHGGSHAAWAEGYGRYSDHEVKLLALPARYWKWRMHGGAVTLARRLADRSGRPDVILATDMLDVTTFRALAPQLNDVPLSLYMHENQLTYPLPADPETGPMRRQGGERDQHYGFINFASMLAADSVFFNSEYHRESVLEELPRFLRHFPEERELTVVEDIALKATVLPVGIDLASLASVADDARSPAEPPLILWNQRWEYDKDPEAFFSVLREVQEKGAAFRLALCGKSFQRRPSVFDEARLDFAAQLIHVGHAPLKRYRELLWEADVTVSTALHEFFGIAVLEAACCRTLPLLPRRLSYPEVIPREFHADCLYESRDELVCRLAEALQNPGETRRRAARLAGALQHFDWRVVAPRYDQALGGLRR